MTETMTRVEREDLQRLIRQREKVLKSAAKHRSTELLADFENQMGAEYAPEDDPKWAEVVAIAEREIAKAQRQVQVRCRELGIPKGFEPGLEVRWRHRGYDNILKSRRAELRKMAETRIAAIEQKAIVDIEMSSVETQTKLAIAGLTSDVARSFLDKLPTVESLMPALSLQEFTGDADPAIAEQLVSPNALRQRRFREKQRLLKGGGGAEVA